MATLIHDCPHCKAANMSFIAFGARSGLLQPNTAYTAVKISIGLECPSCHRTASATTLYNRQTNAASMNNIMQNIASQHFTIPSDDWELVEFWPKAAPLRIPEFLPPSVEKAFVQGETNLSLPGCEEAATTMFRRSLDLGLKIAFPDLKGDLFRKIDKLADTHEIPLSLAEWAHQVRMIGNDGAHDLEGCTEDDAQAARDFVDAVLRYLFSLPGMIAARRQPAAEPPDVAQGQFA